MSVGWSVSTVLETVSALSIIRFRTAIKEPVEIVFLFWSLAVGIVVGAGLLPLAVIGSALIGVILLLFANRKVRNAPYILVLNCTDETAELRGKNASTDFVNAIAHLPGVGSATLVSYNGEYLS